MDRDGEPVVEGTHRPGLTVQASVVGVPLRRLDPMPASSVTPQHGATSTTGGPSWPAPLGSVPVALVYAFFVEYYVSGLTGALKE